MSTIVSAPAPKRRSFGALAFVFVVVAFVLRTIMLGVHTSLPADISGGARDAAGWVFFLVLLVAVPIIEITGIALGIGALFRSGDRKVLGVVSAVLNALSLVGGVTFAIILIAYVGHAH